MCTKCLASLVDTAMSGHAMTTAILKPSSSVKTTLGMNKSSVHSHRALEEFLSRDITESSRKIEKDCFQIVFIIFVMGHVLAPTTKHDYATIDFGGALSNTDLITQFNW